MSDLPQGWAEARLDDLAEEVTGSIAPQPAVRYELYSVPAFPQGIPEDVDGAVIGSNKRPVAPDDVLLCKINPRINRVWFVGPIKGRIQLASTEFIPLRLPPGNEITSRYLMWYLRSPKFRDWIKLNAEGATGSHTRAKSPAILRQLIPIAPLRDQKRIVDSIEEQFSRLDAGKAALERVRQNLKRLRAAIVMAALAGAYTDHIAFGATAQSMIDKKLGQVPSKRKQSVVNTPSGALPRGWASSNLDVLSAAQKNALKAGPFGSALKKSSYVSAGFKIYGQEQVIKNDAFYGDYYIDADKYQQLFSCAVHPRDLLISLVGTIGRTLILPSTAEPGIINPRLIKITMDENLMSPEFMSLLLQSPRVRGRLKEAAHGGTMDVVNLGMLRAIPVPCPPKEHQAVILSTVEQIDNAIIACERLINDGQLRSERLRSSILVAAFSGNLVPQNSSNATGTDLLARIGDGQSSSNDDRPTQERDQRARPSKVLA